MSHGAQGRRRRAAGGWVVEPLEGRVMLSRASAPSILAAPAEVASTAGQQRTTTTLQALTQANARRPSVTLTATVAAPGIARPVSTGGVRFSVISPVSEVLGVAHPNVRGSATLKTSRLSRGETYVIEAQYFSPSRAFATSSAQLDVTVAQSPVSSFRITAPQYFGAPGTPLTFSVTALDRAGQTVTDYTGTVEFLSPTDHSAQFLPHTYTFTTADEGTHEFPDGVTFHKGGAEVLKLHQVNNTRIVGSQAFGIE
jgi:hypothetical protein